MQILRVGNGESRCATWKWILNKILIFFQDIKLPFPKDVSILDKSIFSRNDFNIGIDKLAVRYGDIVSWRDQSEVGGAESFNEGIHSITVQL